MTLYECRQDGLRPLESKLPGSGNGFLAISKDARYIALRGNEDNRPHIRWQHTSNIESQGIFRTLHGAGSARFSNDSKLLATLGGNHLTIWDMTSHECVKTATVPIPPVAKRAPRRLHWTRIVEHSPDFCNVFICRGNESYLCEPGAERPRFALTAAPSSVAYSPDNRFLALALLPRWITCLEIWDIAAARCQIAFKWPFTDHRNLLGASCVAFSPYGTTVAVGGGPGIVIWDFDET